MRIAIIKDTRMEERIYLTSLGDRKQCLEGETEKGMESHVFQALLGVLILRTSLMRAGRSSIASQENGPQTREATFANDHNDYSGKLGKTLNQKGRAVVV